MAGGPPRTGLIRIPSLQKHLESRDNKEENSRDQGLGEIGRLALELASTLDEEHIIDRILDAAVAVFGSAAVSLILIDWEQSLMYFRESRGPGHDKVVTISLPLSPDKSIAGYAATHRTHVLVPDVSKDPRHYGGVDDAVGYSTKNLLAVPVIYGNQVLGVLELINKPAGFTQDDVELLTVLAAHTAVALQNALALEQLHNFFQQAIEALIETYQAFDPVSREHVLTVARLATALGKEMQLGPDEMENLCYASLLHDLGKIKCSNPHDPAHVDTGARMLEQVTLFSRLVPIVRYHHERFNGSGPHHLAGEAIPLLARVLAIAEAFCEEPSSLEHFLSRFGEDFDPALRAPFERALPGMAVLS